MSAALEVEGLDVRFGQHTVLNDIWLELQEGEFLAILGPSGSGKTTLLRAIAGLEPATGGQISYNGQRADQLRLQQRRIGFVFQSFALFRHMTVFDNVAFGLRAKPRKERLSNTAINQEVLRLLSLVQLEGLEKRYPHQLSGGQAQRVALGRALAIEPRLLLLDEPFGALDAKVRRQLRHWLADFHVKQQLTSILVTHDQAEAFELADRVVILNQGRVEQTGAPTELLAQPATPFVREFLDQMDSPPLRFRPSQRPRVVRSTNYRENS